MLRRRGCRLRVMTRVDEQACALGEELVVELGVGGEDQGEAGVVERVVERDALQAWSRSAGTVRVVVAELRAEALQEGEGLQGGGLAGVADAE